MAEKKPKGIYKVRLKKARLSFPDLWRPKLQRFDDGGESRKFKATFLLDKKEQADQIDAAWDQIDLALADKFGGKVPKLKAEKFCLRDGDLEEYDGYEGMMYIGASNSKRPPIVGRSKEPLQEDDGKPYAGCYVNATLHIWVQNNDADKGGKRVNASLEAIQFVEDGQAFGAPAVDIDEEFEEIEGGDEDDAPRGNRASRGRSRDEDEDEPPRRSARGRSRDEDEDEPPRRSARGRSRDEDEDEPPRRSARGRARDEDEDASPPERSRRRPSPLDDE